VRWERVPPPEPCTSPDGHSHRDIFADWQRVPVRVVCTRCGRPWQVVVFEEEDE